MNTTEYKGFTITHHTDGRFYLPTLVGNSDGYASINAAKGAITKVINAPKVEAMAASSNDADKASVPASTFTVNPPAATTFGTLIPGDVFTCATFHHLKVELTKASATTATYSANYQRFTAEFGPDEAVTIVRAAKVLPDLNADNLMALLKYHGMDKKRDTRSRNKREGRYAGKGQVGDFAGKHCRVGVRPVTKSLKDSKRK